MVSTVNVFNFECMTYWVSKLVSKRDIEEVDQFILHSLNQFCNYASKENIRVTEAILSTVPTKLFAYHYIKVFYLLHTRQENEAKLIVTWLRGLLKSHSVQLSQMGYKKMGLTGFWYLLNTIPGLHAENIGKSFKPKVYEHLCMTAKSIVLGVKLYFLILVNEPAILLKQVAEQMIDYCDTIPEWHYLMGKITGSMRYEDCGYKVVLPSQEEELESFYKAIDMDPNNYIFISLLCERLLNFLQSGNKPFNVGVRLNGQKFQFSSRTEVAQFIHEQILKLTSEEGSVAFESVEVNKAAGRFYRNGWLGSQVRLRNIVNSDFLHRDDISELSKQYLEKALYAYPEGSTASISRAWLYLQNGKIDDALFLLKRSMNCHPLKPQPTMAYFKVSLGVVRRIERTMKEIEEKISLANAHGWPTAAKVHLQFLLGLGYWIRGNYNNFVLAWVKAFDVAGNSEKLFRIQFKQLSRNKVRKYIWPAEFLKYETIRNMITKVDDSRQYNPNIPEAALSAILEELWKCAKV